MKANFDNPSNRNSNYLQGKKFVFSVREVEEWTASSIYIKGTAGNSPSLSSSKGDVGGKGRRCVTAPAPSKWINFASESLIK